jgi:hypothetical protein
LLGYVQYAEAVPALLVGFHVFGAVVVFASVQQLQLVTRRPVLDERPIDPGGRLRDPDPLMPDGYRTSTAVRDPVA